MGSTHEAILQLSCELIDPNFTVAICPGQCELNSLSLPPEKNEAKSHGPSEQQDVVKVDRAKMQEAYF